MSLVAVGGRAAAVTAPRIAAVQDKLVDPIGVLGRIGERDGGALRDAEQGDALKLLGVDHRPQIAHEGLE